MKTWFITGASRGFGALVARDALAAGDSVVATARNPNAVVEALGQHANLVTVALDVTDEDQAHTAAKVAEERFSRIDVLLNNAGFGLLGAVEEASAEEIERLYRTNVFGLLGVCRAVLPHMRDQRSWHVINISSVNPFRWLDETRHFTKRAELRKGFDEFFATPEGKMDPREMIDRMIEIVPADTGYFRNVMPRKIEDMLRAHQLAAWENKI